MEREDETCVVAFEKLVSPKPSLYKYDLFYFVTLNIAKLDEFCRNCQVRWSSSEYPSILDLKKVCSEFFKQAILSTYCTSFAANRPVVWLSDMILCNTWKNHIFESIIRYQGSSLNIFHKTTIIDSYYSKLIDIIYVVSKYYMIIYLVKYYYIN